MFFLIIFYKALRVDFLCSIDLESGSSTNDPDDSYENCSRSFAINHMRAYFDESEDELELDESLLCVFFSIDSSITRVFLLSFHTFL